MNYRNIIISLKEDDFFISTRGLAEVVGNEIKVRRFDDPDNGVKLIEYLIDYILDENPIIKSEDTISYGLWLLKFVDDDGVLNIFELDDSFQEWVMGAEKATYYFQLQKNTCEIEKAEFSLPKFTQLIAISEGVLDGMPVQGIRYKEPEHMCGWYLTTELYDGNIAKMKVVPLQELVIGRKDILEFLALPEKFAFKTFEDHSCQIWKISDLADDLSSN